MFCPDSGETNRSKDRAAPDSQCHDSGSLDFRTYCHDNAAKPVEPADICPVSSTADSAPLEACHMRGVDSYRSTISCFGNNAIKKIKKNEFIP